MKINSIYILSVFFFISITLSGQNNRPQEPNIPYNYTSEDITFENPKANDIKLAGTLTLPKNVKQPAVAILISGSGPQNRNEEVFEHKPFLVLADYLTNNGIAVLRYDDRGIASSEGDFKTATSFDFATDVEAAINYLKSRSDIDPNKIGLIGHSEGGLIAPIVVSKNNDVAFIVLLAGSGVDGQEVLQSQSRKITKMMGATEETLDFNHTITSKAYEVIKKEKDVEKIKKGIETSLSTYKENLGDSPYAAYINDAVINQLSGMASNVWLTTFIRTSPEPYLSKTTCPVLAINGSKDVQVLAKLNLVGIESALKQANNKDVTIKELEGLNHLFQTAETGSAQEYAKIEETFSPTALVLIKDWILERF